MACPIHWYSKHQPVVAPSTMEAECIAGAIGAQECLPIEQLLKELKLSGKVAQLWCDNQSALKFMENDIAKTRAKHIDMVHFSYRKQKFRPCAEAHTFLKHSLQGKEALISIELR